MEQNIKESLVIEAMKGLPESLPQEQREFEAMKRACEMLAMLNPGSLPMKALEADVFVAHVDRIDYEQTSTRYVLTLSDRAGASETIRTLRTDGRWRIPVESMLKEAVGRLCVIYKVYEEMKNRAGQKTRVALYLRPVDE